MVFYCDITDVFIVIKNVYASLVGWWYEHIIAETIAQTTVRVSRCGK
jgi:hypothetical protein